MKFKLKYITLFAVIASFGSIIYGFAIKDENTRIANKFIGAGTAGLFLVAMPLFLIKAGKGKQMKDYMLTKENIKKMQSSEEKKAENR